ncbi:hypothetical protein DOY81_004140 [Sarcophaga bullata]|nr:hypothetical protein DOY81_004140 [Sarcophaga bullata]
MSPEKSIWAYVNHFIMIDEIDGYLYYFGGTAGVLTLTGIAAASAYYFVSRPIPEKPLVPLEDQSPILEFCHDKNH